MKKIVDGILQRTGLRHQDQEVSVKNWAASLLSSKISEILEKLDKTKSDISHTHESSVPIGAVFSFFTEQEIPGYLRCNGAEYEYTKYPKLAYMLGGITPPSLGTTKFIVPDLRGHYLRGADDTTTNFIDRSGLTDPRSRQSTNNSAVVGVRTSDQFGSHTHYVIDYGHRHDAEQEYHSHDMLVPVDTNAVGYARSTAGITENFYVETELPRDVGQHCLTTNQVAARVMVEGSTSNISVEATGSAETRPKSVLVNYYIKHD
jgi:hypothetical protein